MKTKTLLLALLIFLVVVLGLSVGANIALYEFFGDSRAYQWPEPEGMSQIMFINRGIGSQTTMQSLERYDDHVNPLHPQIILIQVASMT